MNVVSVVGPGGSGKSTLVQCFSKYYPVLSEEYDVLSLHGVPPTKILSKWNWISRWFNEVLKMKATNVELFITDRCPLDAVAYVTEREVLLRAVLESLRELKLLAILVYTFCLDANTDILRKRLSRRKQFKKKYDGGLLESNVRMQEEALGFFRNNKELWSMYFDSSNTNLGRIKVELRDFIKSVKKGAARPVSLDFGKWVI